jgi:glycosyltransferase involved in cell wall biosynthesis
VHLAILIGHFPPGSFGGAEIQAESWARRLADQHRVTVITRRDPPTQAPLEDRDGFRVVRLPVSRLPLWRTLADVAAIERAVRALEPAPDLLLCFQTFVSGLAGVRVQAATGIPAVVWIRGEAEYRFDQSRLHRWLSPRVWRAAAGVLVQSEANRVDLLHALERHAPAAVPVVRARLAVIPNGLDLPKEVSEPGPRVLSVGRLIRDKGMDVLIEAARGLAMGITIAGQGPERAALESLAARLGVDARFEGFASRERLDTLYREAACVVLAARRGEGLPNVVLEAMAHGRAVVATACAGTRDLLVDGVNGLIVPADDAAALRVALERLRREPGLAARLGAEARRTAEGFDWRRVRPQLEDAIRHWARP